MCSYTNLKQNFFPMRIILISDVQAYTYIENED